MDLQLVVEALDAADLLARTRELARRTCDAEADLLVYLGEIDARELYLDCACSSMYMFCVSELGFSEGATYNRIGVARAARQFPAVMDALRSGAVHLAGLRLLTPKLTADNHREVLADATGKSKREIEEIVARLAPRPDAPTIIRRIPDRLAQPVNGAATADDAAAPNGAAKANGRERHCQKIAPLNTEMFRIHFTASRQLRDKLREAQDLLDRTAKGDVATIFELALDALIERTRKKRFGIGAKPRKTPAEKERPAAKKDASRAIPRPMRRSVVNRDESRCAFVDQRGKRCPERRVEFDHIDGFAITGKHDFDRIRLLCRAHNQQAADALYGRSFMNAVRSAKRKKSGAKKGRSPPPASE